MTESYSEAAELLHKGQADDKVSIASEFHVTAGFIHMHHQLEDSCRSAVSVADLDESFMCTDPFRC